jgi:hypothetical protein
MAGRPVEVEKRARRGVVGSVKCGALLRRPADGVGVKVPVRRWPFAWAGGVRWYGGGTMERLAYRGGNRGVSRREL